MQLQLNSRGAKVEILVVSSDSVLLVGVLVFILGLYEAPWAGSLICYEFISQKLGVWANWLVARRLGKGNRDGEKLLGKVNKYFL